MGWENSIFPLLIVVSGPPHTGLFVYSGPPAKGSLVGEITAPGVTSDPFGNSIPSSGVANFGTWNASGTLTSHFGINNVGDIFLANTSGLVVVQGHSADGSLRFYSSAGVGAGNLNESISPAAGTDTPGNNYVQGFGSYDNVFGGQTQINGAVISVTSGISSVLKISPSNGLETFGPSNLEGQLNAGTLQFFNTVSPQAVKPNITGSGSSGAGVGSQLTLDSGHGGGGASDATIQLESSDSAGVAAATVAITAPIISLNSTRAQIIADTWHTIGAALQPPFLNSFSAGGTAPRFEYEPVNAGRIRLSGAVNTGAVNAANTAIFTLPSGYRPSRTLAFATPNNITAYTLGGSSVQVITTGDVQLVPASTAGKFVLLDGICFELD